MRFKLMKRLHALIGWLQIEADETSKNKSTSDILHSKALRIVWLLLSLASSHIMHVPLLCTTRRTIIVTLKT